MGIKTLCGHGLRLLACGLLVLASAASAAAQGKTSESVVKATARADKPDDQGNQTITLTLTIDKPWHLYANPVDNEDLKSVQTQVKVTAGGKAVEAKVDYPAGKPKKDESGTEYKVFEGKVTIKAHVKRAKDATGALQMLVKIQACDNKSCLFPATLKVNVEQ